MAFGLPVDKIEVLVHPQSIIHSMVEYNDGSVMAQLGLPDMRLPIQFALRYPKRSVNGFPKLDFLKHNNLTFEMPDTEKFPCLRLSYEAIKAGGTMPAVMNAANEEVVSLFIGERINFIQIPQIIEKVMEKHQVKHNPSLEDIIEVDLWAREVVKKSYNKWSIVV